MVDGGDADVGGCLGGDPPCGCVADCNPPCNDDSMCPPSKGLVNAAFRMECDWVMLSEVLV